MSLALIPKPEKFEIAPASVKPSEALTVEAQRPSKPRAVSSKVSFDDQRGSWTRGGINE
jgi:hypothetical protein